LTAPPPPVRAIPFDAMPSAVRHRAIAPSRHRAIASMTRASATTWTNSPPPAATIRGCRKNCAGTGSSARSDAWRTPAIAPGDAHVGNVMPAASRCQRRVAGLPTFVGEAR